MSKKSWMGMPTLHIKSSLKVDAQSLMNVGINQVIQCVLNHSHRDRTGNTVIFEEIQETLDVLIGKVENIKTLVDLIREIGNPHFQFDVGSIIRKVPYGLISQK